jgi:hypothetical protein
MAGNPQQPCSQDRGNAGGDGVTEQPDRAIRLLSENPLEQIDIYLSTWESANAAQLLVRERARMKSIALTNEKAESKGRGVAYCLRNAREFFTTGSTDTTRHVLTSYYGLMSFMSAILVAEPDNDYDLGALEKATSRGHGLGSVDSKDAAFPEAQKVYVKDTGFFTHYLKHIGVDYHSVCLAKRPDAARGFTQEECDKLASLGGLLARVPEMAALYFEVTEKPPLNVSIFGSTRNLDEMSERRASAYASKGIDAINDIVPSESWVGFSSPARLTSEFIDHELSIPLGDISMYDDTTSRHRYWHGRLDLRNGPHIWQNMKVYKSALCPSSWIKPVLCGLTDPLAVHMMLLYILSIFVRYRPKLWREITEGELHDYNVLIRLYMTIVRRVVPEMVLERIADRQVQAIQPGSWYAPM